MSGKNLADATEVRQGAAAPVPLDAAKSEASSTLPAGTSKRPRLLRRFVAGLGAAFVAYVLFLVALRAVLPAAIVAAPNAGKPAPAAPTDPAELRRRGVDAEFRVEVGPPAASLAIWVVEPAAAPTGRRDAPSGTVLVLHGIRDRKASMVGVGKNLAAAGYRAVLVDLRGHGDSTGDFLTFGVAESRDLAQVLDALDAKHLLAGRVGVYGASYGGAAGLQLAARDPRIAVVVAVSTFASLRGVAPGYVRRFLPGIGRLVPAGLIRVSIDEAGRRAAFDPEEADTAAAVGRTTAAILLLHGRDDVNIPWFHSQRLYDAPTPPSVVRAPRRLAILDGEDHASIMADREGVLRRETLAWFRQYLGGQTPTDAEAQSQPQRRAAE